MEKIKANNSVMCLKKVFTVEKVICGEAWFPMCWRDMPCQKRKKMTKCEKVKHNLSSKIPSMYNCIEYPSIKFNSPRLNLSWIIKWWTSFVCQTFCSRELICDIWVISLYELWSNKHIRSSFCDFVTYIYCSRLMSRLKLK